MTGLPPIEFTVWGTPVPQGSKRVLPTPAGPRMIESNATRLLPWRADLAATAANAMGGAEAFLGPIRLDVTFLFARPLAHFGTGRNRGTLKPSAPVFREQSPDLDKLLRSVLDGLTGIVYRDDGQVADVHASKRYGQPSAVIRVHPLRGEPLP